MTAPPVPSPAPLQTPQPKKNEKTGSPKGPVPSPEDASFSGKDWIWMEIKGRRFLPVLVPLGLISLSILQQVGVAWQISLLWAILLFFFIYIQKRLLLKDIDQKLSLSQMDVIKQSGFSCRSDLDSVTIPPIIRLLAFQYMSLYDLLPEWTRIPNLQSVYSINKLLYQYWPYIQEIAKEKIKPALQELLDEETFPAPLHLLLLPLQVVAVDVGNVPPMISGITFHHGDEATVVLDVYLRTVGNLNFTFRVGRFRPLQFHVHLRDLLLFGPLRITFGPFRKIFPCTSAIRLSFPRNPNLDFTLTVARITLTSIPVLSDIILSYARFAFQRKFVLPLGEKRIQIADDIDVNKIGFSAQGMLHLILIRGVNLTSSSDIFGVFDPYCKLKIGNQERTSAIKKGIVSPEWKEEYDFLVEDLKKDVLTVSVYDWGRVGSDELIGSCSVQLSQLLLPLESCVQQSPRSNSIAENQSEVEGETKKNSGGPITQILVLDTKKKKKKKQAEIHIKLLWAPWQKPSSAEESMKPKPEPQKDPPSSVNPVCRSSSAQNVSSSLPPTTPVLLYTHSALDPQKTASPQLSTRPVGSIDGNEFKSLTVGVLIVRVHKASNVLATRPVYVNFQLGNRNVSTEHKTSSFLLGWDQEFFLPVSDISAQTLLVTLLEEGVLVPRPLGTLSFPIKDIQATGATGWVAQYWPLENTQKNNNRTELQLTLIFKPVAVN